jgi:mycothiol synthase
MQNITIRSINGNDITEIVKVWNKSLPLDAINEKTFYSKIILDENFNEDNVLIAEIDNVPVGFVIGATTKTNIYKEVDPDNIRCWITALAVDPQYRKTGIGKKLIEELFLRFKNAGKRECYIATYPYGYFVPGVDIKEYSNGIEFLKHNGFEEKYRPLSMDSNIVLIKFDQKFHDKIIALEKENIRIQTLEEKYILSYIKFMKTMPSDWLRVARNNLLDYTRGIFSLDQVCIAVQGDEVVGYCQFEGSHFGPFGVSDKFQGKGIGTILLGKTVEMMRIKGYHDAWVLWTDDIAANVYQKLGFKETRRFVVLCKKI